MITQEKLKEILSYDPASGNFVRLVAPHNSVKVGDVAGTLHPEGYILIKVDGKRYRAHRLAWLYVHGVFPPDQIDHINGVRADNRLSNLRPATNAENQRNRGATANNKSGHKGVRWHPRDRKWLAQIALHGVQTHLGLFDDINDAIAAYAAGVAKYHGLEFGRTE